MAATGEGLHEQAVSACERGKASQPVVMQTLGNGDEGDRSLKKEALDQEDPTETEQ